MIVTRKAITVYKVEMTAEQALLLTVFFKGLSPSDIDAACLNAKIQPGTKEHGEITEAVNDLAESLAAR